MTLLSSVWRHLRCVHATEALVSELTRTRELCLDCRLFLERQEFEQEVGLYRDPVLKRVLPDLIRAHDNADGAVRSRSGFVFPPFFVLERGMTLSEWSAQERGTVSATLGA